MTVIRKALHLNGDPATSAYRHAFMFFVALMALISAGLGVVIHVHLDNDHRRDCQVIAAVLASGPRSPAPLTSLGRHLGCPEGKRP